MATDRAAKLRNAEKLLRQGKPDAAISEYLAIVADQPRDWNTANILGDLYVRGGQTDKAVDHFIRIADGLSEDGFLQKAIALYKKVLKLRPEHEHALLQAGEIAASQGLMLDARTFLNALGDRRRARGDERGLAQVRIRLGSLDPADYAARFDAARARVLVNDTAGAVRDFKEVAAELAGKDRQAEAVEVLREAAGLAPDDDGIREQLLGIYFAAGDYARARQCASTAQQFRSIATRLEAIGQDKEALAALREAAKLDPSDNELTAKLARAFIASGDLASAAEYLTAEAAGNDPQMLLIVAERHLRAGRTEDGLAIARRLLEEDPSRRELVALLGLNVAERAPEVGQLLVGFAADAALAQQDWPAAAAAFQEFVTRVPGHIPSLMRLVEICVDGRLEATMYSAQGQLADAYIAAGSAQEARFIAEDLVAHEPWDRSNVERFRRALVLMGEPDPDALIAERLSGESPFTSTDLSLGGEELPSGPQKGATAPPPVPASTAKTKAANKGGDPFELSTNAVDLHGILGELGSLSDTRARTQSVEVDLSIVLDDIRDSSELENQSEPAGVSAHPLTGAARRTAFKEADEDYRRGLALHRGGQNDEAISALRAASRAPRLRFAATSLLGRILRERGMIAEAIEAFERAAEAPAPTPDEEHALLFDLADVLETSGETARALAICMELHAEAGEFRDISTRIDRLSKAQSRG